MQITETSWNKYIEKLSGISQTAADKMQKYIDLHGTENRQALIEYANALIAHYGEASGALSCQMYEELASVQGVTVPTAEPAELPAYGETAKAINGTLKQSAASLPGTVSRLVKQSGADTTLKNAIRDGAEAAWVPHGDTCAFCITLASRGWERISKKTLKNGHAEHIHAHCDCEYAVRFDGKSTVEGYDPDKYLEMYENAEGATPEEKINSMRRMISSQQNNRFYFITEKSIGNANLITTGDSEADKVIQGRHRELLREAMEKNGSKEVAYVLNEELELLDVIYGTDTSVDLRVSKKVYMVLHNHPNNTEHSLKDIHWLSACAAHGISVVKNNGECSLLVKSEGFKERAVKTELRRLKKKYQNDIEKDADKGYTKVVKEFLKESKLKKCGLKLMR